MYVYLIILKVNIKNIFDWVMEWNIPLLFLKAMYLHMQYLQKEF